MVVRSHAPTPPRSHLALRRLAILGGIIACAWVAVPAAAIEKTIGGHQIDLDTTLSMREVVEENHSTTHERTLEQLRVRAAVTVTDWLRFDSTTMGFNGGPTMKADRSGIYNLNDVFQDISPGAEFEEAYFDIHLPSVDLRLGKQKVAWGKLDRSQPNDLINTMSYSDPFLQDEAERKIGVPAIQASYYLPSASLLPAESRLTAVWVPQYVPFRFPIAQCDIHNHLSNCDTERWFPPAAIPVTTFNVPKGPGNLAATVPVGYSVQNVPSPALRLDNSEIALRYAALIRDIDLALYYFHGFDPQPAFNLTATAYGPLTPDLGQVTAATTLSPSFHQINAWGGDFAYAFDRITVRGEGAFVRGRPFSRDLRVLASDPQMLAESIATALHQLATGAASANVALPPAFVVHDAVEWGLGADYVYEGYVLLLQVNQTDIFNNHVNLLINNVETRLLANLRKSFFAERLEAQLVGTYAIESDYTILRPRLRYQLTDALTGEIGYLFIAGRTNSVGGQYDRNGEGWVRLEYRI